MIAFCPHCENEFYVPVDQGGNMVKCSKCKRDVEAPEAPEMTAVSVGSVSVQVGGASGTSGAGGQKQPPAGQQQESMSGVYTSPSPSLRSTAKRASVGAAKGSPSKSFAKKRLKRRLNLYRGMTRLVFVISLCALIPGVPELVRYMIDRSAWRARDMVDCFLPWPMAAFGGIWVVYGICLCIAKGFRRTSGGTKGRGFRRLTFAVSLLPLTPAIYQTIHDLMTKSSFRLKTAGEYFLYWPVASFAGVWIGYIAIWFIVRGFCGTEMPDKSSKGRGVRPLGSSRPSRVTKSGKKSQEEEVHRSCSWRTS
jgi:hypothetical protein